VGAGAWVWCENGKPSNEHGSILACVGVTGFMVGARARGRGVRRVAGVDGWDDRVDGLG
jgi:hypothetical protein